MEAIVVTGVSTGIGREICRALVAQGHHVFGSVRRESDAADAIDDLGSSFTPLLFDVTDGKAVRLAADQVSSCLAGRPLRGLVNNAGIATAGPLAYMPLADFRAQLETNVTGVLQVTQAFLPLLRAERGGMPGRIVNIGSVSGSIVLPFLGAYSASKFALEALSDALRRELALDGIEVALIQPGNVRTPIWDKAEQADPGAYKGTPYHSILEHFGAEAVKAGRAGHSVERVARCVCDALRSRKPKARYPLPNARVSGWLLPRWLPDRWLDALMTRQIGLRRTP